MALEEDGISVAEVEAVCVANPGKVKIVSHFRPGNPPVISLAAADERVDVRLRVLPWLLVVATFAGVHNPCPPQPDWHHHVQREAVKNK